MSHSLQSSRVLLAGPRAGITRARPDQHIALILLDGMRDPADRAAEDEDCEGGSLRQARNRHSAAAAPAVLPRQRRLRLADAMREWRPWRRSTALRPAGRRRDKA